MWYPVVRTQQLYREGGAAKVLKKLFSYPLQIVYAWYYALTRRHNNPEKTLAEQITLVFRGLHGLVKPFQVEEELRTLLAIVEGSNPARILEIGTATGGTLFLVSRLAHDKAHIISIDLPAGHFGGGYPSWRIPFYKSFASKGQKVHLIRGNSHDSRTNKKVMDILSGEKLDFLYIDGDHTYEGVKNDFIMYSVLVKSGGMIAMHDIARNPSEAGCNVHAFWEEIKLRYRHKEIIKDSNQHGAGIGILFID